MLTCILWIMILQDFVSQYTKFTQSIGKFDQRLGHIVCQAFEDCSGTESIFKVR